MKHRADRRDQSPDKMAFTIAEAVALSSLGQTSIYRAIREKQLIARKYGTRTIIRRDDLAAFLKDLPPSS
jgi:excisionase family DNA binding protein